MSTVSKSPNHTTSTTARKTQRSLWDAHSGISLGKARRLQQAWRFLASNGPNHSMDPRAQKQKILPSFILRKDPHNKEPNNSKGEGRGEIRFMSCIELHTGGGGHYYRPLLSDSLLALGGRLAIIGCGTVTTLGIIYFYIIFIARCSPKIHIAIGTVITIRLVVPATAEPPCGTIGSSPCRLKTIRRSHGFTSATTTSVLRSCNINDPIRRSQWASRSKNNLPVTAACRRKYFHSLWTTVDVT